MSNERLVRNAALPDEHGKENVMDERVATELRMRAELATPGPWRRVSVSDRNDRWTVWSPGRVSLFVGGRVRDEHDAAFITAANPATILALLDELDRLRAKPPPPVTIDPERPWDHPYDGSPTDPTRCIHCGYTGSYAHTEDYYRKWVWPALSVPTPLPIEDNL